VVSTSIVALMKCTPWLLTKVRGQLKVVKMFSYKNFAVTTVVFVLMGLLPPSPQGIHPVVFVRNTLASTHLVA